MILENLDYAVYRLKAPADLQDAVAFCAEVDESAPGGRVGSFMQVVELLPQRLQTAISLITTNNDDGICTTTSEDSRASLRFNLSQTWALKNLPRLAV